jgi:hypothetical protein
MTSSSMLRVAISDTAEALEIVKLEVEEATGYQIARAIERTSRGIDVLGVWNAKQPDHEPVPIPSQLVFGATDHSMPDVAKRAVRDQLATARWHPSTNTTPGGDIPHWQLAVPVLQADGEEVVAVHRRNGYSLRYTPEDVVGTWLGLAS